MTGTTCPTAAELAAAFTDGPSSELERHLAGCGSCAREWAATAHVVGTYRTLPWQDEPAARIEEQRTALLARAALGRPAATRRWAWWTASALAAAAVVMMAVGLHRPTPGLAVRYHGTLTSHGPALFTRMSARPDEIVTLVNGTLAVEVSPLGRGERFRVATTDAEVEVRGTAFEVSAEAGRLLAVRVWHGRVEVRPAISAAVVLGAGETWTRPGVAIELAARPSRPDGPSALALASEANHGQAPSPAVTATAVGAPAARRADRRAGSPRVSAGSPPLATSDAASPTLAEAAIDPSTLAYQEAWSALRAGDHAGAARGFERVVAIAPRSPLVEEAWYWRAVALARSHQDPEARMALAAFLEHYPTSPRAGPAAAMLGWLVFDAGDLDGAEARFVLAAGDAAPAVRESAQQGLDAVRRRRHE